MAFIILLFFIYYFVCKLYFWCLIKNLTRNWKKTLWVLTASTIKSMNTLVRPLRDTIVHIGQHSVDISVDPRPTYRSTLCRQSTNFRTNAIECRSMLAVPHVPYQSTRSRRIDRYLMVSTCKWHVGGFSVDKAICLLSSNYSPLYIFSVNSFSNALKVCFGSKKVNLLPCLF